MKISCGIVRQYAVLGSLAWAILAVSAMEASANVCDRSAGVVWALEQAFERPGGCAAITEEQVAQLKFLRLQGRQVDRVAAEDFRGMTSLTQLYVSDTDLTSLPPRLFVELPSLNRVTFTNNDLLRALPAELFWGVHYAELGIEYNKRLRELPPGLLRGSVHAPLPGFFGLRLFGNPELAVLPADLLRSTEGLLNAALEIPAGSEAVLKGGKMLQELSLTLLDQLRVEADLLTELKDLRRLWLHPKRATVVDPAVLRPVGATLSFVSLIFPEVTVFPPGLLSGLPMLARLAIKQQLTELDPMELMSLKQLSNFYLRSNLSADQQALVRDRLRDMGLLDDNIMFLAY